MPDFSPVFDLYKKLRNDADVIFAGMSAKFPQCVTCKPGCSDCCHALFDISLVEAMYINDAFARTFKYGPERSAVLERASDMDRQLTKLKRELYRARKNGESVENIMELAARAHQACPLLDGENHCLLYVDRPITCRLYGVPVAIGGKSHVCGFSEFDQGQNYPTVKMDRIQARLEELSAEIGKIANSRFEVADIYVPLSMALLTRYDDAYFGHGKSGGEA